MNKNICATSAHATLFFFFSTAMFAEGSGNPKAAPDRPARPVIRGRSYAVSSMRPESTQVAERILRPGDNGFVLNERLAESLKSKWLRKYPTSVQELTRRLPAVDNQFVDQGPWIKFFVKEYSHDTIYADSISPVGCECGVVG